jgi:hypothetical protein
MPAGIGRRGDMKMMIGGASIATIVDPRDLPWPGAGWRPDGADALVFLGTVLLVAAIACRFIGRRARERALSRAVARRLGVRGGDLRLLERLARSAGAPGPVPLLLSRDVCTRAIATSGLPESARLRLEAIAREMRPLGLDDAGTNSPLA